MVGLPQKVPKAQIVGDWQTFGRHHYTFAFQLDCVLCMHYQPSLETGCWAPRKPLV